MDILYTKKKKQIKLNYNFEVLGKDLVGAFSNIRYTLLKHLFHRTGKRYHLKSTSSTGLRHNPLDKNGKYIKL